MITSRSNALIKLVRSLSDKSARDETGLFIVEGVKSVKETFSSGFKIKTVVATEKGLSLLGESPVPVETVTDDVFKTISGETSPQGALALVYKPANAETFPKGFCVFLDEVKDPSNVGAIIRTAAAAGYDDVYLADCADAYNPKAVRASMGGIFKVVLHVGGREELLKRINVPLVIADMGGENLFNRKPTGKICLVIGNEGRGVSEKLKSLANEVVSIPMENGMESLNAAVSAGILMYGLNPKKQLRAKSGKHY